MSAIYICTLTYITAKATTHQSSKLQFVGLVDWDCKPPLTRDGSRPGSTKVNGREPKTCLWRVFNNKLGCFGDVHVLIYVDTHPHL